jgi:hypothetical protein
MSVVPLNLVLALLAFAAGIGAVIVAVVLGVNAVG